MHLLQLVSTLALFVPSKDYRYRKGCRGTCLALSEIAVEAACTTKYDALLDWLRSKQADISSKIDLQPSSNGGGYGAFVTELVEEGELLFTVPRQACITLTDAMDDATRGAAFSKLIDRAGPGGNTVVMAGFMAREYLRSLEHDTRPQATLSENSSFGPYLATLPWVQGVNNQEHILYWTDDDVESNLKGSMCYEEAKELREEVALAIKVLTSIVGKSVREYRGEVVESGVWPWEKVESLQGPVDGLAEAVKGAFVCLLTRSFQDGDLDGEKMVPMLDMLQHSEEPNVSHAMRQSDGTVEVRARRSLQAGEELLNQYRSELEESMPYHRFFTRFGFVPGIQEPVSNLLQDQSSIFFAQTAEV
jgi:SET domain